MSKEETDYVVTRVFLFDHDNFVLMRRNKPDGLRWLMPGGECEPGEPPEDCAVRETLEETGVTIDKADLHLVLAKFDPIYKAMMYFYACYKWTGDFAIMENEKFDMVIWTTLKKLPMLKFKSNEHLGVLINEARDILLENPPKKPLTKPIYNKW